MALTSQDVINGELSQVQLQRWLRENLPTKADMAKDLTGMDGVTFTEILKAFLQHLAGCEIDAVMRPHWRQFNFLDDKLREAPTAAASIKSCDIILRKLGYSSGLRFGTMNQANKRCAMSILSRLILYGTFEKLRLPAYLQLEEQLQEMQNAYEKKLEELDQRDEAISADEARLSAMTNTYYEWKQQLTEVNDSLPGMRAYANKLIHESRMLEEEVTAIQMEADNLERMTEEAKEELNEIMEDMQIIDEANVDFEQLLAGIDSLTSEQKEVETAQLISDQRSEELGHLVHSAEKILLAPDLVLESARDSRALQNSVEEAELECNNLTALKAQLMASREELSKVVASREKGREKLASAFYEENDQLERDEMELQTQIRTLEEEANQCKDRAARVENYRGEMKELEEKKITTLAGLEQDTRKAFGIMVALCEMVQKRHARMEQDLELKSQEMEAIREELKEMIKPTYDVPHNEQH